MLLALTALLAAAAPSTVLVAPFAVHGEASEWAGIALAESVLDVVVQANKDNFLTLKQLDAILRRRDLKLVDAASAQTAVELGRTLGATDVVVGDITFQGDGYALTAKRIRTADGSTVAEAKADGGRAALPVIAQRVARELLGVSTPQGPMTRSARALEMAARCEADLARQSLGAHSHMTLPQDKLAAAERDCRAALEADPALGLARAGLAVTCAVRGNFSEARLEAEAARKSRFVPLAVLAAAFGARKMHDAAASRALLQNAVDERPGFLQALGYLAEDRMEAGADQEALELFDRYLQRSPNHPWAMGKKARQLSKLGRREEGIALSEKALALDPGDPELLIETASRYIDAKRDAKAEPLLRRAAQSTPPRPLALLRLGYLYLRGNKLQQAREALLGCIAQARRDDEARTRAHAHADLARIEAKQGNYAEAVAELALARKEGLNKLPCKEPELMRWKDKPELRRVCLEAAQALNDEKPDDDAVPIDL